jgi:glycosyltransferase involved in cell wall biosynthesis
LKVLGAVNTELPFATAGGIHWMNTVWHLAEAGATVDLLGGISPSSGTDDILSFYGLKPHPRLSIRLVRPLPVAYLNQSQTLRARAYFLELLRLIRALRPEILYGMGMPNHIRVLRLLKRLVPFRVVLELHETHCTIAHRQDCMRLTSGALPALDGIVTTSQVHRDLLIEDGLSPHRVHNFGAAHREDLVENGERRELLSQLKLPIHPDDLVVIYGGNLYGDRGAEDLIFAFERVARQVPNAHLVVLGTGEPELEDRFRVFVKNNGLDTKVHFTGRVSPTAVWSYLAVADVGVIPNPPRQQWEYGFPMKLAEYLGAGLAVVATDLQTTAGFVAAEEAALLVSPDSFHEMADAIIRLLKDEDLRRTMQERALRVGKKLTYKARAESVYQFLGRLIGGH